MKKAKQAKNPGLQVKKADTKPIHIGIPLIVIASALYLWWFWGLHATTSRLLDDVDRQQKLAQIEYVQSIGLVKGKPAIVLPKDDPFRAHTRWMYVSASSPIPSGYIPTLTKLTVDYSKSIKNPQLHPDAAKAISKLFKKAAEDGFPLMVASAYRSSKEQKQLKAAYVREHSQALADLYIADPGTSEHEIGLGVDIDNKDSACEANSDNCSLSPATAAWLAENAPSFGFIVRYPEGKESKTGVGYEPWHLRYIGKDAQTLTASKLTLDEFVKKVEKRAKSQSQQGQNN